MKYIDADKLKAEIDKRYREYRTKSKGDKYYEGMADSLDYFEQFIDSLQQEQPEVDLKKEIEEHADTMPMCEFTHDSEVEDYLDWARTEFRHFYELGLKARKEE